MIAGVALGWAFSWIGAPGAAAAAGAVGLLLGDLGRRMLDYRVESLVLLVVAAVGIVVVVPFPRPT